MLFHINHKYILKCLQDFPSIKDYAILLPCLHLPAMKMIQMPQTGNNQNTLVAAISKLPLTGDIKKLQGTDGYRLRNAKTAPVQDAVFLMYARGFEPPAF